MCKWNFENGTWGLKKNAIIPKRKFKVINLNIVSLAFIIFDVVSLDILQIYASMILYLNSLYSWIPKILNLWELNIYGYPKLSPEYIL